MRAHEKTLKDTEMELLQLQAITPQRKGIKRMADDAPAGELSHLKNAYEKYKEIQKFIDETLENSVFSKTTAKGEVRYRKTNYWKAIAKAYEFSLTKISEEQVIFDGGDWGFRVTYRATDPSGRSCDADGSCFASEKQLFPGQDSVHNVLGHATTRAKDRAIADLVGFGGEVYDEAVKLEDPPPKTDSKRSSAQSGGKAKGGDSSNASEPQMKMLMAISYKVTGDFDHTSYDGHDHIAGELRKVAKDLLGLPDEGAIPWKAVTKLKEAMERAKQGPDGSIHIDATSDSQGKEKQEPITPEGPRPDPSNKDLVF